MAKLSIFINGFRCFRRSSRWTDRSHNFIVTLTKKTATVDETIEHCQFILDFPNKDGDIP